MKIETLNNYYNDENTYIVYDEITKNGVVIDPGYKCEGILKAASDDEINIKYILITHCHYDHISDLESLREKTKALLVSGKNAVVNIGKPEINHSVSGLGYELRAKKSEIILNDNESLTVDGLNIKCIYTPGHTDCGVCYIFNDKNIFTGDTLFLRSIGRYDLPTGNGDELVNSIKTRLYTLDDETMVFPGHGGQTSIGYEKKFNMYVKG
ncbi:MAG: MBL fold metallo-hydrolase [Clostridia bacterium]|nr:MBL fold metallo-hydrolase [Clostridia bacterium]